MACALLFGADPADTSASDCVTLHDSDSLTLSTAASLLSDDFDPLAPYAPPEPTPNDDDDGDGADAAAAVILAAAAPWCGVASPPSYARLLDLVAPATPSLDDGDGEGEGAAAAAAAQAKQQEAAAAATAARSPAKGAPASLAAAPRRARPRQRAPRAPRGRAAAAVAPAAPLAPPPPPTDPDAPAPRTRADALALYRSKKALRLSLRALPILYTKRKANADRRPRVGGRFVSREVAARLAAEEAAAAATV